MLQIMQLLLSIGGSLAALFFTTIYIHNFWLAVLVATLITPTLVFLLFYLQLTKPGLDDGIGLVMVTLMSILISFALSIAIKLISLHVF